MKKRVRVSAASDIEQKVTDRLRFLAVEQFNVHRAKRIRAPLNIKAHNSVFSAAFDHTKEKNQLENTKPQA
jgi:hypothetical protein